MLRKFKRFGVIADLFSYLRPIISFKFFRHGYPVFVYFSLIFGSHTTNIWFKINKIKNCLIVSRFVPVHSSG